MIAVHCRILASSVYGVRKALATPCNSCMCPCVCCVPRYIVNAPSMFPLVWRGVKPWVDVKTTNKIQIFTKVR